MKRREFLHPRRLAHVAGQVWAATHELSVPEQEQPAQNCSFLRFGHRAMATDFEFLLPFGAPGALDMADLVFGEIDNLEAQLSVYKEESEVSRINQLAWQHPIVAEPGLFDLLLRARQWSSDTAGAFDIAAGALIKAWGFFRGPRRVPRADELARARGLSGMSRVLLDADSKTVGLASEGVEINLGAVGKGYALDCAMKSLASAWNVSAALLHGGRSSIYAIGSEPGTTRGWTVAIQHPWRPGRHLGLLSLSASRGWGHRRPHSSTWNTRDENWAIFSIRAWAGPPMVLPAPPSWPPVRPRPTPWQRLFLSWDRRRHRHTAAAILKWGPSCSPTEKTSP